MTHSKAFPVISNRKNATRNPFPKPISPDSQQQVRARGCWAQIWGARGWPGGTAPPRPSARRPGHRARTLSAGTQCSAERPHHTRSAGCSLVSVKTMQKGCHKHMHALVYILLLGLKCGKTLKDFTALLLYL